MAYKKAGQYLTEAEWQVMECVWEKAPCTGREVWEWFQGRTTWSRSTPLTLLGRLENKGYVKAEKIGGRKQYTPCSPARTLPCRRPRTCSNGPTRAA